MEMPFSPFTTNCSIRQQKRENEEVEEEEEDVVVEEVKITKKDEDIEIKENEKRTEEQIPLGQQVGNRCRLTASFWNPPFGSYLINCGGLLTNSQFLACCNGGLFGSVPARLDPLFGVNSCQQGSILHPVTACLQTFPLNLSNVATYCPNSLLNNGGSLAKYAYMSWQYGIVQCP